LAYLGIKFDEFYILSSDVRSIQDQCEGDSQADVAKEDYTSTYSLLETSIANTEYHPSVSTYQLAQRRRKLKPTLTKYIS